MAAGNKFQPFVDQLAEKVHNLASDSLKVVLTNTAPTNTWASYTDLTGAGIEVANGNGYVTGGATISQSSSTQTSGTYKLVTGDCSWTASGAGIGPFRYAVLYNDTASNDGLIAYWDYGSSITLNSGETFTFDCDGTTGIMTIT